MSIATLVFKVRDAQITVRQSVGWDTLDTQVIYRKLIAQGVPINDTNTNRISQFAHAVTQTTQIDGSIGFEWVTANSSGEALFTAYNAWGEDEALVLGYIISLQEVEKLVPGDDALKPATALEDEKKVDTPPSE